MLFIHLFIYSFIVKYFKWHRETNECTHIYVYTYIYIHARMHSHILYILDIQIYIHIKYTDIIAYVDSFVCTERLTENSADHSLIFFWLVSPENWALKLHTDPLSGRKTN
jgi:hypothetical protein